MVVLGGVKLIPIKSQEGLFTVCLFLYLMRHVDMFSLIVTFEIVFIMF